MFVRSGVFCAYFKAMLLPFVWIVVQSNKFVLLTEFSVFVMIKNIKNGVISRFSI